MALHKMFSFNKTNNFKKTSKTKNTACKSKLAGHFDTIKIVKISHGNNPVNHKLYYTNAKQIRA